MIRFPKCVIEALLNELDNCYKSAQMSDDSLSPDVHMLEEELAHSDAETQRLYKVMASGFRWNEIEFSGPADARNRYQEANESK